MYIDDISNIIKIGYILLMLYAIFIAENKYRVTINLIACIIACIVIILEHICGNMLNVILWCIILYIEYSSYRMRKNDR